MYILPWQQPGDVQLQQEFSAGLAGDLFVAQDRDEFIRQLNYRRCWMPRETLPRMKAPTIY